MLRAQMGATLPELAMGRFSGAALASPARCRAVTKRRDTSHSPVHRDLSRASLAPARGGPPSGAERGISLTLQTRHDAPESLMLRPMGYGPAEPPGVSPGRRPGSG